MLVLPDGTALDSRSSVQHALNNRSTVPLSSVQQSINLKESIQSIPMYNSNNSPRRNASKVILSRQSLVNGEGSQGLVEYSSIPIKEATINLMGQVADTLSTCRRATDQPYLNSLYANQSQSIQVNTSLASIAQIPIFKQEKRVKVPSGFMVQGTGIKLAS